MFEILRPYRILEKIVAAMKVMHITCTLNIITTDGETQSFSTLAGIFQGNTLVPFIFIIVDSYVMRVSIAKISEKGYQLHPKGGFRQPTEYSTDTDFAENLALIRQSLEHKQDLLVSLEQASFNGMGLYLDKTKNKYL